MKKIAVLLATASLAACGSSEGDPAIPTDPATQPPASASPRSLVAASGKWSDPATWGGAVPGDGDEVRIPTNARVVLDTDTAALAGLTIEGDLIAEEGGDLSLTSDFIVVNGAGAELRAGDARDPFTGTLDVVLSGTDPSQNVFGHGAKVLMVKQRGTLALFGERKLPFARLEGSIAPGDASLTLDAEPVGWAVGDEVAVAPTDFDADEAERRTITRIDGRAVTLDRPFTHAHWGEPAEVIGGYALDMRTHVGNLTRNIRVSSIENEERVLPGFDPFSTDGQGRQDGQGKRVGPGRFGGHMTYMRDARVMLDAVEVTGMGQQGVLVRYPVHWHLTKETSREDNFLRHSSVHTNFQRAVVIHQAEGVEVEDNVVFDTPGHGIYFEDGIEHDNTVARNLVMGIRYVPLRHRLSRFGGDGLERAERLAGIWITNPANVVEDNVVAGVENGWGYNFAEVRSDKLPVIDPEDRNWRDNRSYAGFTGNTAYAIGFNRSSPDGLKGVFNLGYGPEEAGSCFRFEYAGDYESSEPIRGSVAFKCANAAFWSTNFLPIEDSVIADSRVGVVNDQGVRGRSLLRGGALVGMTRNNPAGREDLTSGPFPGPVLKSNLESGPVAIDDVATAYAFEENYVGLSPAVAAQPVAEPGPELILPDYLAIKAGDARTIPVRLDRSNGYDGWADLSLEVPKPSNHAGENPYHGLEADPLAIMPGTDAGRWTIRNEGAETPGSSVAVVRMACGTSVLETLRVLTATAPRTLNNAGRDHDLTSLIEATSPRNPGMSQRHQNFGGDGAVDDDPSTSARFAAGHAPWIRFDFGRSYTAERVVLTFEPGRAPIGDVTVSWSDFSLLDRDLTLTEARALDPYEATHITVPRPTGDTLTIDLPDGATARQVKVWFAEQDERVHLAEAIIPSQ